MLGSPRFVLFLICRKNEWRNRLSQELLIPQYSQMPVLPATLRTPMQVIAYFGVSLVYIDE
jgi:hypothetical protein